MTMPMITIILMAAAMAITLGIVVVGIVGMARGGEFNQRWGNKLMRARILFQLLALVFFALAMLTLGRD